MNKPRVRIAPSPTGFLHVGTARTALFNYLFAKKHGGAFVLRIEDTDLERSDQKFETDIIEGLEWLGIKWDEGPIRQSGRIETYKRQIEKLLEEEKAFYCFHSEAELAKEREELMAAKKPPLHLCEYRSMDAREARTLADTKPDHVIRFKTPAGRTIVFNDLIRSEVKFESDLIGDFSIAKNPDVPLYNFAVVVDDFEMKISHVIRGEDHIPNTPKQMLLIEALGFAQPEYAHLPLILGPDRSKLSKRHGATSINEFKAAGYLPEALFNFLALLGWNPGDDREIMAEKELAEAFSLEKIQKSGAIFDLQKLNWMNSEYIKQRPLGELAELIKANGYLPDFSEKEITAALRLELPRLKTLSELKEPEKHYIKEPRPYDAELLRWKSMTNEEIKKSLDNSQTIVKNFSKAFNSKNLEERFLKVIGEGDKGAVLWPLRAALTGKKASPGPFEIMEELGPEETLRRIRAAMEKLS